MQINNEDTKLISFLNKAKTLGLEINKMKLVDNKLIYYIKQSEDLHTFYIPKDITTIYGSKIGYTEKFTKTINNLKGTVKFLGGESLEDVSYMFNMCEASDLIVDLTKLNISNVITMEAMFYYAELGKVIFGDYTLNKLQTVYTMFGESTIKEIQMGNVKSNNIVNYSFMFYNCHSSLVDISGLKVTDNKDKRLLKYMFNLGNFELKSECPIILNEYQDKVGDINDD